MGVRDDFVDLCDDDDASGTGVGAVGFFALMLLYFSSRCYNSYWAFTKAYGFDFKRMDSNNN